MKKTRRLLEMLEAVITLTVLAAAVSASAGTLGNEKGLAWASQRDLTSQQFSEAFDDYRQRGYVMVDVDAYPDGGSTRYAMVWQENKDGRGWAEHRDMTSEGYNERWEAYKAKGFRPLDVEAYRNGGSWAGIWVENTEGFAWSSHRGLDSDAYGKLFDEKQAAGFRLVDVEVYDTSSGLRYAAIWYQNTDKRAWAQLRGLTREQYQQEVDSRSAQGMRVVDFESYKTSSGQRYAAIWEPSQGLASQTRTDRTEKEFANLWRQYRDEGYRLADFERYDTASGPRYAGVWVENETRLRYSRKGQLDGIIESYRRANNLPGISVAIIQDGQMLYRRGFGWADVEDEEVAHGETVYLAASVSKTVGGTLAALLEDEGRLRNGKRFNLDLDQPTSTYLTNMPAFHTHTVEQLLAHLGCVAHYPGNTTPGISNQTRHYTTAMAAVQSIWKTGLVTQTSGGNSCTVGTTGSYSTPGFTFVAAVLESATGRTINQLVQDELLTPQGLSGMRVQYASAALPADHDRATPYDEDNDEMGYTNNSWKVLGGGIETHPVDLARFGWKVLNGDIVSANTRDNRLWAPVIPARSYGLGWDLSTDGNRRRTAEHGGSWAGAAAFLRAYRDDGLVIAIMSNRTDHTVDGLGVLANKLGNEVLR